MTCEVCGHEQDRGRFCGHCGARVSADELPVPQRAWARPERWVPAAAALIVLVVVLGRLLGPGDTDRSASTASSGSASDAPTVAGGPVFPEDTGTVLFFDDGTTGAVGLDLDAGTAERLELPGQRAGDQPYRLWRLGHQLVVGWDEVAVVTPGPDGTTRTLGRARYFLPAADPQHLWLIGTTDAGDAATGEGAGREGAGAWTLVSLSGQVIASIEAIPGYEPVRGLPRGLALRDGTGRLWRYDIAEDVLVDALQGASPSWIGDVVRSQVAWCSEDPCRSLTVADAGGAEPVDIGSGETFSEGQVWLSPAGDHVAAVVMAPAGDGAAVDRRLRVYRTATGDVLADAQVPLGASGSWAVDGRQFFGWIHAVDAGDDAPAVLARWAGGTIQLADARDYGVADVHDIVSLPRSSLRGVTGGGAVCPESERSDAMGSLPAWRGEGVHVAVAAGGNEPPAQLLVGIPGAGNVTSVTVSARLADGERQASFRTGAGPDWRTEITLDGGRRTAADFPPHWGLESRFPEPGCWAVTVSTGELTETVTMEIRFDAR